ARGELLALSPAQLVGSVTARAGAHRARVHRDPRGGDHRLTNGNTLDAVSISAWASAGNRERDADDSEPGAVWVFDSAAVHRRHRRAHSVGGAGALFAVA